MADATINAEYEQLKYDSQRKEKELNDKLSANELLIKELKSQIDKVNLSARDAIIKSYTDKLPEIKENRENVKAKLELMAEKIGTGAEFSEYAEMLLSKEDTRVKVENPSFEFSKKETQKDMTIQEFAEWQFNLQYGKKGE
jgi:ribosomal protein S16